MADSWRPDPGRDERIARSVQSMIPGTIRGRVAQAAPVRREPQQEVGTGASTPAIWSAQGSPVDGEESPPWVNLDPGLDVGTVVMATRSTTTGSTTMTLLKNGTAVVQMTLPAGAKIAEGVVDGVTVDYGDMLSVVVSPVGAGLNGLTITALLSE